MHAKDILLGCLAPVLVDAVFKLDNGEIADFDWKRSIEEDSLLYVSSKLTRETPLYSYLQFWVEALSLFPFLQLLGSSLDLGGI